MSGRVHLHIDRLVLRGVPADGRDALVAALSRELRRQWAAPGAAAALGSSRHLAAITAGPARPATGPGASALGRSFGGMLAGELSR